MKRRAPYPLDGKERRMASWLNDVEAAPRRGQKWWTSRISVRGRGAWLSANPVSAPNSTEPCAGRALVCSLASATLGFGIDHHVISRVGVPSGPGTGAENNFLRPGCEILVVAFARF
jgi:hypothetical protein